MVPPDGVFVDESTKMNKDAFQCPEGKINLSPEQEEGHYGDLYPTFNQTGYLPHSHFLLHACPDPLDRVKIWSAFTSAKKVQKGNCKMKPFMVVAYVEKENEVTVLFYSKDEPIFAENAQDARQEGFARAVRADPTVKAADVKVFILPFV